MIVDTEPSRVSTRLLRPILRASACAAVFVVGFAVPSSADTATPSAPATPSTSQVITLTRPAGQVILTDVAISEDGHLHATVIDTRSEDPGWSVTVSSDVAGWRSSSVASAPQGHGLGITSVSATLPDAASAITITIT